MRGPLLKYHEYVFTVCLFIAISTVAALAFGLQSIAGSLGLSLCGLLLVAVRREIS